jgi:Skp family chaperone for outer membrane proteins
MSRLLGWSVVITFVLTGCIAAENAAAQDSSPPPSARSPAGPAVALLDVGYIFNNCTRFKALMEELKADLERTRAEAKVQRNEIAQLSERLQQFRSGTPDYEALDAEIAKRQAEFTAKLQLRNRDFGRRQAKIYLDIYKEICNATNDYVERRNIDIVLQFNGNPVDPEQPESVREYIGRTVVSYRNDLDITPAILQYINRPSQNRAAPGQSPRTPPR